MAHSASDATTKLTLFANVITTVDPAEFEAYQHALISIPRHRPKRSRRRHQTIVSSFPLYEFTNSNTVDSLQDAIIDPTPRPKHCREHDSLGNALPSLNTSGTAIGAEMTKNNNITLTIQPSIDLLRTRTGVRDILGHGSTKINKDLVAEEEYLSGIAVSHKNHANNSLTFNELPDSMVTNTRSQEILSRITENDFQSSPLSRESSKTPKTTSKAGQHGSNSDSLEPIGSDISRGASIYSMTDSMALPTSSVSVSSQINQVLFERVSLEQHETNFDRSSSRVKSTAISRPQKRKRRLPIGELVLLPPVSENGGDNFVHPDEIDNYPIPDIQAQCMTRIECPGEPPPIHPSKLFRDVIKTPSKATTNLTCFRVPRKDPDDSTFSQSLLIKSYADGFEGAERMTLPKLTRRIPRRSQAKNASTLVLVGGALPTPCFGTSRQNARLGLEIFESTKGEQSPNKEHKSENGSREWGHSVEQGVELSISAKERRITRCEMNEDEVGSVVAVEGLITNFPSRDQNDMEDVDVEEGDQHDCITEDIDASLRNEARDLSGEDQQDTEDETDQTEDDSDKEGTEIEDANASECDGAVDDETTDSTEMEIDQADSEGGSLQDHVDLSSGTWNGISDLGISSREHSVSLLDHGTGSALPAPRNHRTSYVHPEDLDDILCRPGQASRMRSRDQWIEVQDEIQDDQESDNYSIGSRLLKRSASSLMRSYTAPAQQSKGPEESMVALTIDSNGSFARPSRQLSFVPNTFPTPSQQSRQQLHYQQCHPEEYPDEQDGSLAEMSFSRTRAVAESSSRLGYSSNSWQRRYSSVITIPSKNFSSLAKTTNTLAGMTLAKAWRTPSLPFTPPFLRESSTKREFQPV